MTIPAHTDLGADPEPPGTRFELLLAETRRPRPRPRPEVSERRPAGASDGPVLTAWHAAPDHELSAPAVPR